MRTTSFLKNMDYMEIDARFSNDNAIKYNDFFDESITFEEIQPFLNKLPPREYDLMELYYVDRKNQKDIAKMFGVTQGAISSRLSRAVKRLVFLRDLPKITPEEIRQRLGKIFGETEIEIIIYMMQTTCQSKTAQLINEKNNISDEKKRMTQVKVRHRFEKCLIRLEHQMKAEPDLRKYHQLLVFIKRNLYKLHEVKLPHFDRGPCAVFSMTM
jgi:CRISPR/Cas system-associated endoribonuclease Cas2